MTYKPCWKTRARNVRNSRLYWFTSKISLKEQIHCFSVYLKNNHYQRFWLFKISTISAGTLLSLIAEPNRLRELATSLTRASNYFLSVLALVALALISWTVTTNCWFESREELESIWDIQASSNLYSLTLKLYPKRSISFFLTTIFSFIITFPKKW